jgi:hypothetical protein
MPQPARVAACLARRFPASAFHPPQSPFVPVCTEGGSGTKPTSAGRGTGAQRRGGWCRNLRAWPRVLREGFRRE